jgi:hypothetical protein
MSENIKCRICGSDKVFVRINIEFSFIELPRITQKWFILYYCYGCWKDSLGQYILDQLDC